MRTVVAIAGLLGLVLTAAGAIGAHVVSDSISGDSARWDSALLFGFVHTLAAIIAAALPLGRLRLAAAGAFLTGVALFSGIQIGDLLWAGFAATDSSATPLDVLSMLVPVGGIAFMVGWIVLAAAALTWRQQEK